jgi:uncharacterized protein
MMEAAPQELDPALCIALTERWLVRAVIGLNLCPFAKGVHVKKQIHYCVTMTEDPAELLSALQHELLDLAAASSEERDTTLLIAPRSFPDFLDFNAFLPKTDKLLKKLGMRGDYQIASFHPQFQFEGSEADDITNFTNRAPFTTLHLLRESSIDQAVAAFPAPEMIFERNMATMQGIGLNGWNALKVNPSDLFDDAGQIGP